MKLFNDAVGRKFVFAVLVTILGFVLVLAGKVSAGDWQAFVMVISGLFIVGNLGDKIINK